MLSLGPMVSLSCFFLPLTVWFVVSISCFTLSMQVSYLSSWVMTDSFSFWLVYVTILVLFFSALVFRSGSVSFYGSVLALGVCSYVVFSSSSLFYLYVFFEFSLIPIIYIIMAWGQYPDRFSSSSMMLLYTALFSFPLMMVMFYYCPVGSLFIFYDVSSVWDSPYWVVLIVFFSFSVKLPLYGVHHWLPMAHVEAPTPGSMILAGVLLKLGGCGLVRFSQVFSFAGLRTSVTSYVLFAVILASLISLCQSDFKRLVAYSSVVHMSVLILGVLSSNSVSFTGVLLIMVLHGFSSPMMFLLVGVVYGFANTRLLSLLRGFLLVSPLLTMFALVAFMANIPTPPFSSFTAEVVLFLGFSFISVGCLLFIFSHVVLSVIFNSYWLTSAFFGGSMTSYSNYFLSFAEFITFMLFSLNLVFLSFFIYLF